jgi:tetratricopeptide (TPR) repeat protein
MIEQIRRYLSEQLSESERQAFEQQLAQKPEIQAEVEHYRQLKSGLKSLHAQEMRQKLQQWEAERKTLPAPVPLLLPEQNRNRRWLRYASYAAVASFLLLLLPLGYYVLLPQAETHSYESLLAQELQELPFPNMLRGSVSSEDSLTLWYKMGAGYYAGQNYVAAIEAWEKCLEQGNPPAETSADELLFFIGLSRLQLDQPEAAIHQLQKVGAETHFFPSAEWYLALAGMQAHDTTLVQHQLQHLAETSEHPYQEKALRLLELLEKI